MALHNYIYLKHKAHDQDCHRLLSRDHDNRPNVEYVKNSEMRRQSSRQASNSESGTDNDDTLVSAVRRIALERKQDVVGTTAKAAQ